MQKTIHCCDLCSKETNYQKEPIKGYGFVAHHLLDWAFLPSSEGERLVCQSCNTILRRARDLEITLRPVPDTIWVGGVYTPGGPDDNAMGIQPDGSIYAQGHFVDDHSPSIQIPPTSPETLGVWNPNPTWQSLSDEPTDEPGQ